jgi:hypothetical protein
MSRQPLQPPTQSWKANLGRGGGDPLAFTFSFPYTVHRYKNMKILLKQDKPIALKYNSNRRSKKTLKSSVFELTLNFKSVKS